MQRPCRWLTFPPRLASRPGATRSARPPLAIPAELAAAFGAIWVIPGAAKTTWAFLALFAVSYFFIEFVPNVPTFVYPAEIFPTAIRGTADGISAAALATHRRVTYQSMLISTDVYEPVRLLADPLRAAIVTLLAGETMCTCHLTAETGAGQTTISHHLKVLREAGWVEAEPCGRFTYYRLRPDALEAAAARLGELAATARATCASGRRRPC
jgi:ArsR family transcriptional regulator